MDGNGTGQMETREGWMMENNKWVVDPGYRKMKQEMDQIQNQIVNMTYAPGTGPGGKGGWVIEGNSSVGDAGWVIEGDGSVGKAEWVVEGDKKVMAGGEGGESGVVVEGGVEVKTDDGNSGSNNVDDGVDPGPQGIVGNQGYGDGETGDTHEIVDGDGGEGDYAEGTSADGDCGDGIVC